MEATIQTIHHGLIQKETSHALVTVNYVNKEAKGKLTLTKSGEILKSFNHYVSEPENNKFVFKTDYLKRTEIYNLCCRGHSNAG